MLFFRIRKNPVNGFFTFGVIDSISSHLCADYNIIPPLFPVSSSTRRFPIFTRRSNIDIVVMRLQLFTTGAMIEAPVFINLAPDFPFIWLTIAGL